MVLLTITLKIEEDRVIESPFILFKHDVSEEEFWSFAHEDLNCELLDGVLVIHSPANQEHEDIFGYLYILLRQYLEASKEGKVFGSRFVMRLSDKWDPEPDLLVVKPDRFGSLKEGRLEGPANMIIEILSETTREVDLTKKLPRYLESSIEEVWIIDPKNRAITVHTKDHHTEYTDPKSAQIITSVVFPGLKLRVQWIWSREEYPTIKIINEIIPSARKKSKN